MPDVVMPDGTIIKDVPEGTTQKELLARYSAAKSQPKGPLSVMNQQAVDQASLRPQEVQDDPVGAMGAMAESAVRGVVDIAGATPRALTHDLPVMGIAGVSAGAKSLGRLAMGEDANFLDTFREDTERAANEFPFNVTKHLPAPTSIDLQSIASMAGDLMSQSMHDDTLAGELQRLDAPPEPLSGFSETRDEILSGVLDRREEQPFASGAGDAVAVGASLVAARSPFVRGARNQRLATPELPKVRTNDMRQAVDDVWNSKPVQALRRGTGRTAEAGFEGAFLAATQDRDPLMAAGLAAGSQAVGSATRTAAFTGKGLAATAAGSLVLWQMLQEMSPGGRDRILESSEEVIGKMGLAIVLGSIATIAGAGRSGSQANNVPVIADAFSSLPRGATQELLNDWVNDPEPFSAVMGKLETDPDFFGSEAKRRLERALSGNGPSFKETLESLSDADRQFRRQLNTLVEQQSQEQ